MKTSPVRIYFYTVCGMLSALLGWAVGQYILYDINENWLAGVRAIVLFPSITIPLAMGIIATDIFVNNPTRPVSNIRTGWFPLAIAGGLGLAIGIATGIFTEAIDNVDGKNLLSIFQNDLLFRTFIWILVGATVGVAEGWTWKWRSIQAKAEHVFWQRFRNSSIGGAIAGLLASFCFELIRNLDKLPTGLKSWDDVIGFGLLGGVLGLVLSFSTSPSYLVALRAGKGFEDCELGDDKLDRPDIQDLRQQLKSNFPRLQEDLQPSLTFVNGYFQKIEEGLSIQLPSQGDIRIGSTPCQMKKNGQVIGSHIYIPGLPNWIATLKIQPSQVILVPNIKYLHKIEHQFEFLNEKLAGKPKEIIKKNGITLKHNHLISFHVIEPRYNDKKKFNFVYYNRFLDPLA